MRFYRSTYPLIYPFIYPSILSAICLSICLSIYLYLCISIYLYISIHLSIYMPICLSIHLSTTCHVSYAHRKDIVFSPFAHHLHRKFDQISWHYASKLNISFLGNDDATPSYIHVCMYYSLDVTRLDSFVII